MSLDLPQANPGAVTLSVRGPGGFRELKRDYAQTREANRGFRERREATFIGPSGLDCRLLIDDEEIEPAGTENIAGEGRSARDADDGAPMWSWMPGFYAGAVRAELIDGADLSLGTWWLDVSPDPEKTGSEIFEQMVEEISEFDQTLLVGDEPARRQLGAVGENDDPHVLFERLRRRESDLDRAVAGVQREPARVLRPRRQFRPHRAVRRVDLRTLRDAARQPEACAVLGSTPGAPLAVGRRPAEPRFDVPAVERRLDAPINRCALYLLRSLRRRCRHLRRRLEQAAAKEPESDTRTALRGRLEHRLRILARIESKVRLVERRSPFRNAHRPELTSAGLTAIAAHPLYSHLWRVGWEALRRGSSPHDPADPLPLSPTWEVYERWCFVELARFLERWLPKLEWKVGREGKSCWYQRGRGGDGMEIALYYQKTAPGTKGRERPGLWSVSRECRPDLVLRWRRGCRSGFLALDAKYRTDRRSILTGMAESAHLYRDALRWGSARPVASLLLVPRVKSGLGWLAEESYARRHGVGAAALSPDSGAPDWFRGLVLGETMGEP